MMCEMNVYTSGPGAAPRARINRGRNIANLRELALEARAHWLRFVCAKCGIGNSNALCRPHLLEKLRSMRATDVEWQMQQLVKIHNHLAIYDRSFDLEHRNTDRLEDRAALFSAIGWMSGWGPLLAVL